MVLTKIWTGPLIMNCFLKIEFIKKLKNKEKL